MAGGSNRRIAAAAMNIPVQKRLLPANCRANVSIGAHRQVSRCTCYSADVLRFSLSEEVDALATAPMPDYVAALISAWRELSFDDRCYLDGDGKRREGLQVIHGKHCFEGVRYLLATEQRVPAALTDKQKAELRSITGNGWQSAGARKAASERR